MNRVALFHARRHNESSVRSAMLIARPAPCSVNLRRSGMFIETTNEQRTKLRRSDMRTTFGNSTTMSGANGIMPPRRGLGFFANGVCYKNVAPLALGKQ